MLGIPELPEDLIRRLFNLDQGMHVETRCKSCGKLTDQVVISYELLPILREAGVDLALMGPLIGRLMDIIPLMPILVGRPTVCRCGTVNR